MPRRRPQSVVPIVLQLGVLILGGLFVSPQLRGSMLWLAVAALVLVAGVLFFKLVGRMGHGDLASAHPSAAPNAVVSLQAHVPVSAPTPSGATVLSPLQQVRLLDWFQFERFCATLLGECGFRVEHGGGAKADGGLDMLVTLDGKTIGVQCKQWRSWKVGVKEVREFLGALQDRGLSQGLYLTLQEYTPDAKALASRHHIELAGPEEIGRMLQAARVEQNPKLREMLYQPKKLCPKCESTMVLRQARTGSKAGQTFWGCSTFPRCRYTMPTE